MSDYMIGCKVYKINGQEIEFYYDENRIGQVTVECMDSIIERISNSVEVVRCKECKYGSPNKIYGCRIQSFANDKDERLYADDYCSFGERADR